MARRERYQEWGGVGYRMGARASDKGASVPGTELPGVCRVGVLHPHEEAAHEAAIVEDRDGYLEALRSYMRAGRTVALQARRGAA